MSGYDEHRLLRIGSAELEVESGDLVGPSGRTRLAPQPARLLALLAEHPGRVVTRGEVAALLWPHGSVAVAQGIGYAMREVRRALEQVGVDPVVVETIPRRGFRLRVDVLPAAAGHAEGGSARGRWKSWALLAVVLVGGGLLGAISATWRPLGDDPPPVLLLFEHENSGAEDEQHVGEALGTALTVGLAQSGTERLGVVGPTGTADLDGPEDSDGVRALGACMVLSGSVRGIGTSASEVFTQLVRTSDRVHVWASRDTLSGPAEVERLAERIVGAVDPLIAQCTG